MKKLNISPPVAAVLLAIVLFVFSGFLPNSFGADMNAAAGQAVNIVRLSVFLGIIAAGQTLVIISGREGIDLSAGSVVTLSAILTWTIVQGKDGRVIPALIAVLLVGAVIGFINGAGIIFLKISPFVMTLGMAGVITGIVIIANHGNAQGMLAPIMTRVIARPLIFGIPGAIIIYVFFAGLMWLILERSSFGKNLFAIGVNRITTRLSGVNVTGMVLMTYALAGAL
ncbi:MAG: sugar ABC transporter permease, partial [Chloroflexi bacterium RBG_16_57_11]